MSPEISAGTITVFENGKSSTYVIDVPKNHPYKFELSTFNCEIVETGKANLIKKVCFADSKVVVECKEIAERLARMDQVHLTIINRIGRGC
jgi:hypothetical protein